MSASALAVFESSAADGATEDQLTRLGRLAARQRDAEAELAQLAEKAKTIGAEVRRISEVDIPAVLDETGLSEVRLADGTKVSLSEDLRVTTTGKYRDAINRWLEREGHADLIRNEVTASFGPDRAAQADALFAFISERELTEEVDRKRFVNPQSFAALIRELRTAGEDVPLSELGVMVQRRARLG